MKMKKKKKPSARDRANFIAWEDEEWLTDHPNAWSGKEVSYGTLSVLIERAILAHMRAARKPRRA